MTLPFPTVTHPYGTKRTARVLEALRYDVLVLLDEKNEGHVLMWTGSEPAKKDDTGIITFTQGGPTGGYWKFEKL